LVLLLRRVKEDDKRAVVLPLEEVAALLGGVSRAAGKAQPKAVRPVGGVVNAAAVFNGCAVSKQLKPYGHLFGVRG
jgi:hypothetical protein